MKYLFMLVLGLLFIGCSQNKDKIFANAQKVCHCRGAKVQEINYFGSLSAIFYCTDGYRGDIGENDYVMECVK